MSIRTVALTLLVLSAGVVQAQTTRRVPKDYPTIQDAIDAARQLDTILVSPGKYVENINFKAKLITVTSTNPQDPETVANTIIDGGQAGFLAMVRVPRSGH